MIRPTSSGTTPSTSNTTSTTNTNGGSVNSTTNNSNEVKGNVAAKVSEVFLTASHAFQKIGDLTLQLSHMNSNKPENEREDNSKWSEKEIDQLKDALNRFADELDNISTSVQARMKKQIKIDIRRGLGNTTSRNSTLSSANSTGSQSYQQYLSSKRSSTSSQPTSSNMLSNGPPPTKRFAYATASTLGSPTGQMTGYRPVSINAAGRTVTLQPISRQRYVNVQSSSASGPLSSSLGTTSSLNSQSWSTIEPEPTDIFEQQPTTSFSPASLNR